MLGLQDYLLYYASDRSPAIFKGKESCHSFISKKERGRDEGRERQRDKQTDRLTDGADR